ncbi:MAG: 50S ribosomal protein L18 [Actinomycetia bacterium]|nr:50S ribosomal protein L18 [Actinomycetes bacterium]
MDKLKAKNAGLARRQRRVRAKINGTAARPRLRVIRSNANISAQVIDDVAGTTLVAASSVEKGFAGGSNIDAAKRVGEAVAKRAKKAGVEEVIFDRGGHIYHGRIKALADGARSAGLKF